MDDANDLIKTSKHDINSEDMKLVTRLKDARDANTHQEEGYNAEIKAQTDLANCYKNKASDAEEKCVELTEAVESLQKLLKESSEKYGNVENNLDTEKKAKEEEINRRNEAFRVLRKELDDANFKRKI